MASEITFDHWKVVFFMRKSENNSIFSLPDFQFFVVTREVICQKMAPIIEPVNFWGFSAF